MNDILWGKFDPTAYVADNYGTIHQEDRSILDKLIPFFENLPEQQTVLEIGTGPNLYPTMLALPKASSITCLEYSQQNIDYFKQQLRSPAKNWLHFWQYLQYHSAIHKQCDLISELNTKVHPIQGDIFNLPPQPYGLVMMFFVAESITRSYDLFTEVCQRFIHAANHKGALVATFMENSTGYNINNVSFPAISVNRRHIQEIFETETYDLKIYHIPIARVPLRSGYTGMLLLTARRK